MLEMALEKLDKFISDHPASQFVVKGPSNYFQSKEYPTLKSEVTLLLTSLTKQFQNAEKEFMSEEFLENARHHGAADSVGRRPA